ncbi:MAG TPA: ergothioneine biosynthesis protein EgtB [Stellaceae bacterium]|nr:ergothioneine biosynthesis protein EgtB [Stellaceae bacterium]
MFDTGIPQPARGDRAAVRFYFDKVRGETEALTGNLSPEDQAIQSMPDVSPTKWHLAHTSWFFEIFILGPLAPAYQPFDPAFAYLFNSYYEAAGPRHPRPQRGLLSRPGRDAVGAYRAHVDAAMRRLIETAAEPVWREAAPLVELGLNHEQQHQELILMDIKHVFSANPLLPAYQAPRPHAVAAVPRRHWVEFEGGLVEIGHSGDGFAFDNEGPRHKVWLDPFRLAAHPVVCGEYLDFIADGGYRRPEFWMSEGWARVQEEGWQAPLYWRCADGEWRLFTLSGERRVEPAEPVCHVSFYEADAFARWAGSRLPTEAEWEIAASNVALAGNLADSGHSHPCPDAPTQPSPVSGGGSLDIPSPAGGRGSGWGPRDRASGLRQMIGDVWEWTASPYVAYPRFRPAGGAIGEYNGKFMSNQMVLRGGAAVTPAGHLRITYRNFFPPAARWAFSGLRLAEDC